MYSGVGYTVGLTKFQEVQCTVVLPNYNSQTLGKSWDLTNTNGEFTNNYGETPWGYNRDIGQKQTSQLDMIVGCVWQ